MQHLDLCGTQPELHLMRIVQRETQSRHGLQQADGICRLLGDGSSTGVDVALQALVPGHGDHTLGGRPQGKPAVPWFLETGGHS